MSDVKSIVDQLNANKDEIKAIQSNIARCDRAAVDLEKFDRTIAQLSAQRQQITADAFIAGATADTTEVEKQISDTRAQSSSARDTNEAAKAAKDKLQAELGEKLNMHEGLKQSLRNAIIQELAAKFAEAESSLNAAMLTLKDPLSQMTAIATAISHFGGSSMPLNVVRIYKNGLQNALLQRNASAIGGFAPQTWMRVALGDDEFNSLISQLDASGVPLSEIYG